MVDDDESLSILLTYLFQRHSLLSWFLSCFCRMNHSQQVDVNINFVNCLQYEGLLELFFRIFELFRRFRAFYLCNIHFTTEIYATLSPYNF